MIIITVGIAKYYGKFNNRISFSWSNRNSERRTRFEFNKKFSFKMNDLKRKKNGHTKFERHRI